MSPLVAHPQTWFNNYGFEITAAVLLVWLCLLVDAGCHRARPWSLVVLMLGPLFVQGALLLWPAAIAFVLFDARRTGTLRRSALPFAVTGTAMVAGAGLVYALFYRPVGSKDSITSYWAADSLDGDSSVGTLLRNGLTSLQHGVVPTHNSTLPFEPDVPLWLVLMACIVGVIGAIAISVWRWFFVFPAVGQLGAIVASALTGWPVTPVRLNVPYWTFIIVLVPLGTGVVVAALASRARASERVTSALVVLAALGIVLALWPTRLSQNAQNGAVYARGLSADFARVAEMSGPDNIVLSYHHMSHWYAHDTLMNSEQPGKSFVLLWETLGDDSLYADVDAAIAPLVGPNTDVWCVIPYEVGPDATAQACQITLPGLVQTFEADLGRALVIRYSVAATS